MKLMVSGISFSYNSHPVLSGVSFSLADKKIACVLGVNGAGKSTLLRCINRIIKPHTGSVMLDDRDIMGMSRKNAAKYMAHVPQRPSETGLTVFEAVLIGRKPHIKWSAQKKDYVVTEKIIHELGLGHLAMRPVNKLSGGEMQKVIIARALAQSPEIMLLDEPTSSLDLKNQLEVMMLVRSMVDSTGLSAIIAIHDLNMAIRFADFLFFLKEGRIHAACSVENLTAKIIREVYGVDVKLFTAGDHMVVVPV